MSNVKLVKGLQECIRGHECQKCPYFLTNDCRATLLADAEELLKEQPEIVRCSECNRRASYDCPIYEGGDGMHDEPDDWFCGDGERRV